MVGIVRISDCECSREGVSAWWWPKAEFLWVSPSSSLSPSASVKSAFPSFQGFLEADRAGGAGRSTMGDFKIHKYYAVSSWFGSHTKAGGRCVTKM